MKFILLISHSENNAASPLSAILQEGLICSKHLQLRKTINAEHCPLM